MFKFMAEPAAVDSYHMSQVLCTISSVSCLEASILILTRLPCSAVAIRMYVFCSLQVQVEAHIVLFHHNSTGILL